MSFKSEKTYTSRTLFMTYYYGPKQNKYTKAPLALTHQGRPHHSKTNTVFKFLLTPGVMSFKSEKTWTSLRTLWATPHGCYLLLSTDLMGYASRMLHLTDLMGYTLRTLWATPNGRYTSMDYTSRMLPNNLSCSANHTNNKWTVSREKYMRTTT